MNLYFLKLSWKNIWRNKRRTFLAVNAIAIGVTWLIWTHNYYDALHEQFIKNAIQFQSGHITLSAKGFHKRKLSKKYLQDPSKIQSWLEQDPRVKAYSTRVLVQGLLSSPRGSANIWFSGVQPEQEKQTTHFSKRIVEGSYFESTKKRTKPIVIGIGIKEQLGIRLGSKVVALTQGIDGSIGNELFYVAGIFDSQSQLDQSLAFVPIKDARSLLSLPETAYHQLTVVLNQGKDLDAVLPEIENKFGNPKTEILSWKDAQKHLMATIQLFDSANKFVMLVILLIASVGIANSILMSIMERTREFGVMMAIGTTTREMIKMVLTETFLLSFVGVLLGNLLGVALTLYFQEFGFDLKWLSNAEIQVNGALIQTVTFPTVQWFNNILVTSTVLLLSILAALIPVQHISKLKATTALKAN